MSGETILFDNDPRGEAARSAQEQQYLGVLNLPEFKTTIPLPGFTPSTILGRRDPVSYPYPDIDLAPFLALEKGVSRQHAVLLQTGHKLMVKDLGSRNGTYLNGKRLTPHQLYPLADSDELTLGHLMLRVRLHG